MNCVVRLNTKKKRMNTDFANLDKSDFKCLKTPDGAIYYGQVV